MRLFLVILFSLFIITVEAQQQFSLQQCIDMALEKNLSVKLNAAAMENAEQQVIANQGNRLPNLNGSASHNYNFGRRIDPFTNQFANSRTLSQGFGLSSSVELFNGFQSTNQVKQSQTDYERSRYDAEANKNDITLSIAASYLQILFFEEKIINDERQIQFTQQQLERTKKLYDAGATTKTSVLEIESQKATEELQLVNDQNQLTLSYLSLRQQMQMEEEFSIVQPNLEQWLVAAEMNQSTGQIYDAAISTLPVIKSSELSLKSAEVGYKVAKGGMYPRLSVSSYYGSGYSSLRREFEGSNYGTQLRDNISPNIGFDLTVPIFNGYRTKTNMNMARIGIESRRLELEQQKLNLKTQIESAYADALASLKKYKATEKSLSTLKETFSFAQKQFEVGEINSTDLNSIKTRMSNAESELLQAKYDYVYKTKILEFYQGKSIAF